MNNASGQIHHGVVEAGAAETSGAACASPCPTVTEAAEAWPGAASFEANTVPVANRAAAMINTRIIDL
jgi:hypothetical protein